MSIRARLYLVTVIALGAALVAGSMLLTPVAALGSFKFLRCAALALMASTFKVRLPGMRSSISTSFVVFLVAMSQLSVPEVLLLTIPATVLQCVWRAPRQPFQIAFNVGATIVNTSLATLFYAGMVRTAGIVPALVVASISFFCLGSGLVCLAISLTQSLPLSRTWRNCDRWALPYYAGGAVLAVLVAAYSEAYRFDYALAMLAGVCILYLWYRSYIAAIKDQTSNKLNTAS